MEQRIQRELDIIKDGILQTVSAEAIYLFGSYAYGTPNEDSDLDIYVVVPDNTDDLSELFADIRGWTRHKRTLPMDLLLGRSGVFNRRKHGPTLERVVAQKGIPIYER